MTTVVADHRGQACEVFQYRTPGGYLLAQHACLIGGEETDLRHPLGPARAAGRHPVQVDVIELEQRVTRGGRDYQVASLWSQDGRPLAQYVAHVAAAVVA